MEGSVVHARTEGSRQEKRGEGKTASVRVAVPISRRSSKLGSDKTIVSGWFDTIAIT